MIKAKRVGSKRSVFTWAHRRPDKGSELTRHHKEQKRSTSGKATSVSGLNPTFGYPTPRIRFKCYGTGFSSTQCWLVSFSSWMHNIHRSHFIHECAIFTGLICFKNAHCSLVWFVSRMHNSDRLGFGSRMHNIHRSYFAQSCAVFMVSCSSRIRSIHWPHLIQECRRLTSFI